MHFSDTLLINELHFVLESNSNRIWQDQFGEAYFA